MVLKNTGTNGILLCKIPFFYLSRTTGGLVDAPVYVCQYGGN